MRDQLNAQIQLESAHFFKRGFEFPPLTAPGSDQRQVPSIGPESLRTAGLGVAECLYDISDAFGNN